MPLLLCVMAKTILLSILIIRGFFITAQTFSEKYDLHFQNANDCSWDWLKQKTSCRFYLQAATETGSFAPLLIKYDSVYLTENMRFYMKKSIDISMVNAERVEICLIAKNESDSAVTFTMLGKNEEENPTFNTSALLENTSGWDTLYISASSKTTKTINIYIEFKGSKNPEQVISLKEIEIKMDGKPVDKWLNKNNTKANETATLNPYYIVDLTKNPDLEKLNDMVDLNHKKIIGLGENTHGSKSISIARFEMLKTLIKFYNCKLILAEKHFDLGMLVDLYVQGIITDENGIIDGYLRLNNDYEPKKEFLVWLRKYNSTNKDKVHFLDVDKSGTGELNLALVDYHIELLGKDKAKPYLKLIENMNFTGLSDLADSDSLIQNFNDVKNFNYYKKALSTGFSKEMADRFAARDSFMFQWVLFLDSLFTQPDEKIAILAHSGHLQKTKNEDKTVYFDVLGSLLNEKYKSGYWSVNFCFGSGTFSQDSCHTFTPVVIDSLKTIPFNSFENAALKTGNDYFYYPSAYLDSRLTSTAYITRGGRGKNQFGFSTLKNKFDGYIFIRKSEHFDKLEKWPFYYSLNFFDQKRKQYYQID